MDEADDLPITGSYNSDVAIFFEIISQIDYSEPWLLSLIGAHLFIFVLIVCSRKNLFLLGTILAVLGMLCLASSYINEWAAENWEKFSDYQYFDAAGLFISIVFSIPLLLNSTLILILVLLETCSIMQKAAVVRLTHNKKSAATKTESKKNQ